ncbi:MAG: divergent polysaccharide deacetylase family protein [Candidatus Aureabacteria bacterium]|nr:divergent polysaccharide deacetylase family protein [Candidatus Auribacterota bacterium]
MQIKMVCKNFTCLIKYSICLYVVMSLFSSGCTKRKLLFQKRVAQLSEKKIAIILDDAGNTSKCLHDVMTIKFPVTIAILPSVAYSKFFYDIENPYVKKIIHVPMEANKLNPGPETLYTSMTDEEIKQGLETVYEQFPDCRGFNNHMGSVFMKDSRAVKQIFKFADSKKLFFLNSLTVNDDTANILAGEMSIKYMERDVFLDNKSDEDYIKEQFYKCLMLAEKNFSCIIIGHVRPLTIKTLKRIVPEAEKEGYSFVFLEDLYDLE